MSSYDMDGSPAPEAHKEAEPKKVSFRFCRECSNTLYPFEDEVNSKLMFACKICHYNEPAATACIYRNALKEEIAETAGNVQDVAQDPTVGISESSDDIAMHESGMDVEQEDDTDGAPAFCTLCGQEILCPFCGEPSQYGFALEAEDPEVDDSVEEQEKVELERRERALSGAGARHSHTPKTNVRNAAQEMPSSSKVSNATKRLEWCALFFVCCECQHVWSTIKDDK
ncbi:Hypothetical protein R9X50_00562000 [Acrodontium crateriforme]|uniref:DNA-directed RNA polymerase II subunit RPB9-like zinc ribbon domain-containing protein n=1 Tax=Acrodontium crateriforme TaxID=150365 RepID=A0AAQ3M853_9PEZI|nr:Hypothetical protein R9X50_00562000 [Acrodontium crateriforme]